MLLFAKPIWSHWLLKEHHHVANETSSFTILLKFFIDVKYLLVTLVLGHLTLVNQQPFLLKVKTFLDQLVNDQLEKLGENFLFTF